MYQRAAGGCTMNAGHCAGETGTGRFYLTKEMPTCKNYNKKHSAFRALRSSSVIPVKHFTPCQKIHKELFTEMTIFFSGVRSLRLFDCHSENVHLGFRAQVKCSCL